MNKIVYNACFGGFSLSQEAIKRGEELAPDIDWGYRDVPRHHPALVQIVEELGEKADGAFADLQIEEISGNKYRITEYDGNEEVETPDSIEWVVIE